MDEHKLNVVGGSTELGQGVGESGVRMVLFFFFFKQKTAYEIGQYWSSDVCSSDLVVVSPASVTEDGATNLVYTFTRAGFTAGALTVNFSVGGTAVFGPSPDDYTQTGATTFNTS